VAGNFLNISISYKTQHPQKADIIVLCVILTHNFLRIAAAKLRLRTRS